MGVQADLRLDRGFDRDPRRHLYRGGNSGRGAVAPSPLLRYGRRDCGANRAGIDQVGAAFGAKREIEEAGDGDGIGVTLVSRDGYLTLRPRLYERSRDVANPLRPVFDPDGVELVEANVTAIDVERHRVSALATSGAASGGPIMLSYDRLVLAAGSALHSPRVPGITEHTWNIGTYDGALAFDRHLRTVTGNPGAPGGDTFVIIGGGFTGIELATEMRSRIAVHGGEEVAAAARVIMIDRSEILARNLGDNPRPFIEEALRAAGVETRTGTSVAGIESDSVILGDGERIGAATVVVTAGLRASDLADLPGAERDEMGRLTVDGALRVRGVRDVYATGDVARAYADDHKLALMSCQHALTMGRFAGYNAARDLFGLPLRSYRQPSYVTCLDLGPWGAVFTTGWDRPGRNDPGRGQAAQNPDQHPAHLSAHGRSRGDPRSRRTRCGFGRQIAPRRNSDLLGGMNFGFRTRACSIASAGVPGGPIRIAPRNDEISCAPKKN